MMEEQVSGLQPSASMAVALQIRYVVTGLFIGPMFGAAWGLIFLAIAWFLEYPVGFIPCWALGWLISTVSFALDMRSWFFPAELELEQQQASPPPPTRPAFQG